MSEIRLTPFEDSVLRFLLAGDDPVLSLLQIQLSTSAVVSRKMTGQGFYLRFKVPSTVQRLHEKLDVRKDFSFGDLGASIKGLKEGAGFILWIKDGALHSLEGYSYEENWPDEIDQFELQYFVGEERDLESLRGNWILSS
jgi:hypothetical protein